MPDDDRKSKWYALAEEANAGEKPEPPKKKGDKGEKKKLLAAASENQKAYYEAAGMEVPTDDPTEKPDPKGRKRGSLDAELDIDELEKAKKEGRTDTGVEGTGRLIAIIAGVSVVCLIGVARLVYSLRDPPPGDPQINLPIKNIQWDKSYGYKVTPPEGFRQQIIPEPEFLHGSHGELFNFVSFHNTAKHVEAFYTGEIRDGKTLEQYMAIVSDGQGTPKELTAIPEGMSKYPTKGLMVDNGTRKMLIYVSFAKPNRWVTVYAYAPSADFDKNQDAIQDAVRALEVVEPTGPHPDKLMIPKPAE